MRNILYFFLLLLSTSPSWAQLRDPTQPYNFSEKAQSAQINSWELNAVLISSERRIAVINGQPFKLGDEVGGEKIVQVESNRVQLEGADGKITLFLLDTIVKREETSRA